MREGLPAAAKDKAWTDRCVILLIKLVARMKLVHRHPEYQRVWEHWRVKHGPYSGPTYWDEFNETLKHVEQDFDQEAYGLGQMPIKKEGAWTPGFQDDVYTCIKTVAKEMGLGYGTGANIDLEQSCRLIKAWTDMHPGVESCMSHRCTKHRHVGQLNSSLEGGGECGACILLTCRTLEQVHAEEMYSLNLPLDKYVSRVNADQTTVGPQPGTGGPLIGHGVASAGTRLASELGPGQKHMVSTLISEWHKRFKQVVAVGDEALHTGGFPVMGEVYHRTERTERCKTFHEAFKQLEHILLAREYFQGETLYVRREPAIENIFDFDHREHIWCGLARWSFTVQKGTEVGTN